MLISHSGAWNIIAAWNIDWIELYHSTKTCWIIYSGPGGMGIEYPGCTMMSHRHTSALTELMCISDNNLRKLSHLPPGSSFFSEKTWEHFLTEKKKKA